MTDVRQGTPRGACAGKPVENYGEGGKPWVGALDTRKDMTWRRKLKPRLESVLVLFAKTYDCILLQVILWLF